MDRKLDDLSPYFKPLAVMLLARFTEAGIPVLIVNTRRTSTEQQEAVANGHSWVAHSKHEDGDAIDVVPLAEFARVRQGVIQGKITDPTVPVPKPIAGPPQLSEKLDWDAGAPEYAAMAEIGRGLGLRCGYDWKEKDAGHFEWQDAAAVKRA